MRAPLDPGGGGGERAARRPPDRSRQGRLDRGRPARRRRTAAGPPGSPLHGERSRGHPRRTAGTPAQPARSGAHPVHIRVDRDSQGCRDHARQRHPFRRVGDGLLRHGAVRPGVLPPAPAFRSLGVRHLRRLRGGGAASSGARRDEPAPQPPGGVHPRPPADAVVLGALGPELHDQVRRGRPRRLPGAPAAALVRRGVSDARSDLLDETAAARDVHQSLWADGDHHRQQLLHGADLPGERAAGDPDRRSVRRRAAARPGQGVATGPRRPRRGSLHRRSRAEPRVLERSRPDARGVPARSARRGPVRSSLPDRRPGAPG